MKMPNLLSLPRAKGERGIIFQYAAVAGFISFVFFGWTLAYGYFFSDDFTWLWHGTKIARGEISAITAHMSTFYSPVLNVFYAVMVRIFGVQPSPYFLFDLLAHVAVSSALGYFIFLLTRSERRGMQGSVLSALTGGAYEPLVFVGANMHLLVALFMTLTGVFLALAFEKEKAYWLVLSVMTALLSFGTKEVAIITPVLVAALLSIYWQSGRLPKRNGPLIAYIAVIASMSAVYAWYQFLWQRQSIWVETQIWHISAGKLLRLPLALINTVFPFQTFLTSASAPFFFLLSLGILIYIAYRFRRQAMVWFGLIWASAAALPVIFFQTNTWWELLPSRYTYTARLGLIIALVGIIGALGQRARRMVFAVAMAGALIHLGLFFRAARHEYGYVYRSGRTLVAAVRQIAERKPARVFVAAYRPFRANVAHIVGVMDIVAHLPERSIIFLESVPEITLGPTDLLLFWNEKQRQYEVHAGAI